MGKSLFIAEKPSVAKAFAAVRKEDMSSHDGYLEGPASVVTWCVGHLVSLADLWEYDESLRSWRMETIPFLPQEYRYKVLPNTQKQFNIVSRLLNRDDVDTIYVCTDAGREGEYIYRLVAQEAKVPATKKQLRVWTDSQTEEELLRAIAQAKDISEYDNLSAAAYLRAKEDFLMGINFTRALSIKWGRSLATCVGEERASVNVGRVMTCVLGMIVRREREIRAFVETPFYRVTGKAGIDDVSIGMEWKAVEGSKYFESPLLYKENGFNKEEDAKALISILPDSGIIEKVEKKKEPKKAPFLYNLAEIQGHCTKLFKISPDETLQIIQTLYEKKLVTYPRTDARVLSTAVAKEIDKNIKGLKNIKMVAGFCDEILASGSYKNIAKTQYTDDSKITDHYAIIPTGQGISALGTLKPTELKVYETIVRRFLAIFYPPAIYEKVSLDISVDSTEGTKEHFFATGKSLKDQGYLKVMDYTFIKKKASDADGANASGGEANSDGSASEDEDKASDEENSADLSAVIDKLKKGQSMTMGSYEIKQGKTSPPKRYSSGSLILAMENAGKLIEDEDLRATIKSSGIGTSATRAEVLAKLVRNQYLALNKKSQIVTPTLKGELIADIVSQSIPQLLKTELTASWEMGLAKVADGSITEAEYMEKLSKFVSDKTEFVKTKYADWNALGKRADSLREFYKK